MSFNEYWKEKAAKRRKSWASKAKRFADQHTQLENIRKEVYLPLDYGVNFSFDDYKTVHFIKQNPIVCWQDMNFCFSEDGLRAALEDESADMSSFKMEVNRQSLKGKEAPQPKNDWEASGPTARVICPSHRCLMSMAARSLVRDQTASSSIASWNVTVLANVRLTI